jgi:hypothetical protein
MQYVPVASMYALTHDLARSRVVYQRPLPTLPDIMVIDVPAAFGHPSLPLGRFYPILMETAEELAEVRAFLSQHRPAPVRPDLLDRRASGLVADRIIFAAYDPPATGWPHLLLCHWPPRFSALAQETDMFARGAYTTEMFDTAEDLAAASTRLLSELGKGTDIAVTLIPAAHDRGRA